MTDLFWTHDFELAGRHVRVKKTGAQVTLDRDTLCGAARWLALYLPVRAKQFVSGLSPRRPTVWFAPDRPRPWYLVWAAAAWSGAKIVDSPAKAQAAFYFDDVTRGVAPYAPQTRRINFGCEDISKTRVARTFEAVFGYPLALDPRRHRGLAVEKGEANGVHDGYVVRCPGPRRPGRAYQRLIDNIEAGEAVDLRTPFVGGRPVVVFVKRRPEDQRFANVNTSIRLARPEEVFTAAEIETLSRFARAMRLDWGGLDILRDRKSGRLYVVDVNKTDMPPLALPWIDKLRAVHRLGLAFRALISAPEAQP
jgi:hypothetical protein